MICISRRVRKQSNAMPDQDTSTNDRKAFYDRIGQQNLTPLWEVLHGLVTPEPVHKVQPAIWRLRF